MTLLTAPTIFNEYNSFFEQWKFFVIKKIYHIQLYIILRSSTTILFINQNTLLIQ